MYAPHIVTIYNTEIKNGERFKDVHVHYITVLHGVFLEASKAVNVKKSGLEGADAVDLYIPFGVDAVDGVTGEVKEFIGPVQFWKLEDKSSYWTLSCSGNGGDTFFVKGQVVEPDMTFQEISMSYDSVYSITKVDEKDFGSTDMHHWQIGGN